MAASSIDSKSDISYLCHFLYPLASLAGSVNEAVVSSPGVESSDNSPPCWLTIRAQMARPTVDLVDVDCNEVLRKPVVRSTLLDAVDVQLERRGEPTARREATAMAAKLSFLEAAYPDERLAAADAYGDAHDRLAELEETITGRGG